MKRILSGLGLIVLGSIGGYYWGHASVSTDVSSTAALRLDSDYSYVSPLLLCSGTGGSSSSRDTELEKSVQAVVNSSTADNAIQASVYYRELGSGVWLGVNENEQYAPASMLKVPLAIAYFKIRESQPDLFDHQIHVVDGGVDFNEVEHFKPAKGAEIGQTYTISALLDFMLHYSDNNAKMLLDELLSQDTKQEVYTDLGLSFPFGPGNEADFMSVLDYARFFRVLFNGTYLSAADSNELLSLLTEARFSYGISDPIPTSVPVAEKFGENTVNTNGVAYNELHDCGIVYYPEHPYLLCVMTKGDATFDALSEVIHSVSDLIYTKMEEHFTAE